MSQSTAHHVEGRVQLAARPPVRVKGKADPVVHYQALGFRKARRAELSRQWEEPLVDRQEELAQIRHALEEVTAGEGRVIVVHGEAGIGKSRLVMEEIERVRQRGLTVLTTACLSYGQDTPYLPWSELLRALMEIPEEGEPAVRLERLRAGMERIGAGEWAPVIGEMLGLPVEETPLTASLTPRLRQQRLFDLTLALIRQRAVPPGLVLVIEDAHWADEASLALLDYLARNLREVPIGLLVVHRPDERLDDRWRELPHSLYVLVEELPSLAVQEMITHLLEGGEAPESLLRLIQEKAQGNPLFAEEMVRALKEGGALRRDNGRWSLDARLSEEQIPDTVHGLLQSRIDRLAETDRRVLQVAACIGQSFSARILTGVYPYGGPADTLSRSLERLTSLGWTTLDPLSSPPTYFFRHTLTREVAYESLAYRRRRELHRRIGEFIERERGEGLPRPYNLLAYHFYQGQVWDKAADYALRAGEVARHEYANEAAVAQFRRALEAAEEGARSGLELTPARLQAHEGLADVLAVVGEYDRALEHYAAARELVESWPPGDERARRLADLCRRTAEVYERKSEYDAALQWLQKGLGVLGREEFLEAARIYRLGAGIYHRLGQNDQAIAWCQRSLQIASACEDPGKHRTLAHLYFLMAEIYRRYGDLEEAVRYARQSVKAYQALRDLFGASQAYNTLGNVYFELGEWSEAARFYRQGMEIKEKVGDVYGQAVIANNLGEVLLYQGDLEAALQVYERSLKIWERLGATFGIAVLHNNLAAVHIRSREWEDAWNHLRCSLELFKEIKVEDWLPEVYRHMAEAAAGLGRVDDALAYAAASLEMARKYKMQLEEGIAARVLGDVYHQLGREEWALQELEGSLKLLETLDSPYETARTHLALARFHADMGRKEEARSHLIQAVEIFQQLGAGLDLEEARRLEV
ncbi:MAG TPA: tetratricopeptide repeat protein [Chloroflexi bacterium]|nr:tetratricopeptide repeat protein [Chloroflexota bacterium]